MAEHPDRVVRQVEAGHNALQCSPKPGAMTSLPLLVDQRDALLVAVEGPSPATSEAGQTARVPSWGLNVSM